MFNNPPNTIARRYLRGVLLSTLLAFAFLTSNGQTMYQLKDCIDIGLENNYSILISKNNEAIATNNYTIGNAGYLPTIGLSGRHNGTYYGVTQYDRDGSSTTTDNAYNTTNTANITLDMTIFNGFSVQTTYKKLNELKQVGELNVRLSAEDLVADIITGYYNYLRQVKLLDNARYAVSLSKERLRIDEDRYQLGSSSKLQVLQSEVYFNADSSNFARQYETVRAAQIQLNELMSVKDLDAPFTTTDTAIIIDASLQFDELLEQTLANNVSLLIASKGKVVSEYDYKLIAARSYPYLDFTSSYNTTLYTYAKNSTERQLSTGPTYGLTLGFTIFDGLNQKRQMKNSSIEVKNKELQYMEIEQSVKADLITTYSAYQSYLRLLTLEQKNLLTATENLDIAMERYKLGNLSGIELREVQKSLLDSSESLLSVQYNTKLAEISLLLMAGRIMEYY